jgi:hapalindole-type alkaloid chlorinase
MNTIKGKEIFFNFIEVDHNGEERRGLIQKLRDKELDGFVARGVLSPEEVSHVLERTKLIPEEEYLRTSNGRLYPNPHATITDKEAKLDEYITKLEDFEHLPLQNLRHRISDFFEAYCGSMKSRPPKLVGFDREASYATLRFFMPNMGGLFVHCGHFFQESNPVYFEVVEEMELDGQLSFFLMLQYPEKGGELTIYDMLWPEVSGKDGFKDADHVLDCRGDRIYLKDVRSFTVRPEPGDLLVFRGGPIWHRVENILGSLPRITFGGFINFSKDGKEFYYWG